MQTELGGVLWAGRIAGLNAERQDLALCLRVSRLG